MDWDPSVLDHDLTNDEQWYDTVSDLPDVDHHNPFDLVGDYCHITPSENIDVTIDRCIVHHSPDVQANEHSVTNHDLKPECQDYEAL